MLKGAVQDPVPVACDPSLRQHHRVARVIRYRRRGRRLRGVREFGPQQRIRFWPETKRSRARRLLFGARPFILLGVLIAAGIPAMDPALVEPVGPLATEPERVAEQFTRCGPGRGHACVVDGDTIRLGDRRIRIIGIDAPEVKGQCVEEIRAAEAATVRLRELLNAGAFEMVGRIDEPTDRYGRELRTLRRVQPDGSVQSIAARMRDEGHARRYLGGLRGGWC